MKKLTREQLSTLTDDKRASIERGITLARQNAILESAPIISAAANSHERRRHALERTRNK